jgi:hypothetical protein
MPERTESQPWNFLAHFTTRVKALWPKWRLRDTLLIHTPPHGMGASLLAFGIAVRQLRGLGASKGFCVG